MVTVEAVRIRVCDVPQHLEASSSTSVPVVRDGGRHPTYWSGSELDVWGSRIGDELGMDEEGELCHTLGDPWPRSA